MECNVCNKEEMRYSAGYGYECSHCGARYLLRNSDEVFATQLAIELANREKIRAIKKLRDLCHAVDGNSPGLRASKMIVEAMFKVLGEDE